MEFGLRDYSGGDAAGTGFVDGPLQEIAFLAAREGGLMDFDFWLRDSCGFDHLIEIPRKGVIEIARGAETAEEIGKPLKRACGGAPCGGEVAVFDHENAAGLEHCDHFAEASFRIGEMEQEKTAIGEIECVARSPWLLRSPRRSPRW